MILTPNCRHCKQGFEIVDVDQQFYQELDLPIPQLCPDCRLRQRMAFRNERTLYSDHCANCQRGIITIYDPAKQFTVYCQECWWGNKFDPLAFGRDFDFSKTLAEQLKDLYRAVPHVALYTTNCVNSEYNNFGLNLNHCYLLFGASNDENCLYGKFVIQSRDTVDALSSFSTELCYESVASERCYQCLYVTQSRDCRDCIMIADCQSCTDCIGCVGLQHKQYYVFNQFVGKEAYEQIKANYLPLTNETISELREKFKPLRATLPYRASHIYASENCTGDLIMNSANCQHCFDIKESENCRYVSNTPNGKDSYDCTFTSPLGVEHSYNACSSLGKDLLSTFLVWNCYDTAYSMECHNSHDPFGCVGLQKQQFVILNKQYTEEDYKALRAQIVEYLKETGEWGEYLHPSVTPFGYNETIAQEYFPLDPASATQLGYQWHTIPDKSPAPATVGTQTCQQCQKSYRFVKAELDFYQKTKLPLPLLCSDCRRSRRIQERGPYRLWQRTCSRYQQIVQTHYAPDQAAVIYCERCYRDTRE
jgi:hypothetical protein